jgi:hypothetical protein
MTIVSIVCLYMYIALTATTSEIPTASTFLEDTLILEDDCVWRYGTIFASTMNDIGNQLHSNCSNIGN